MKLLLYTHFFAPSTGGVETYTRLLAEGLTIDGAQGGADATQVTVVTQTPAPAGYDARFPFPVVRRPGGLELLKMVRRSDVVQLAGPSLLPMLLALIFGRPFIIEQHGYQAACPNGLLLYEPTKEPCPGHFLAGRYAKCQECNSKPLGRLGSLRALLLTVPRRWLCRHAAVKVAVTDHVARRLDLPRTCTIRHGVPDPGPVRASAEGSVSKPITFAYIGRLVSEKGLPLLLQAARDLLGQGYDFRVKMVGDGPETAKLRSMAEALGLQKQVIFTGFLEGEKLIEATSDIAAVVMPSIWEETAGLAAIEQMFRGRLVIASDIGGLTEIVGATGLKFAPGNVEALAACMQKVLDDPEIAGRLGQQARARALECFGLERMLDEHRLIYSRLSVR